MKVLNDRNENQAENIRKSLKIKDRLILSLDVPGKREALEVLKKAENKVSIVKVGLELIYNEGLSIVDLVKKSGYKVMLDAKLMDIPNTVAGAVKGISRLDVNIITLHTLGGSSMIRNANETMDESSRLNNKSKPLFFGVTVLTSLDDRDLKSFGFDISYMDLVLKLAKTAVESGIDGIVCSPNEAGLLRKNLGTDFLIATPGIRLAEDNASDQKRINTPQKAIEDGADFIIVGRSVINSVDVKNTIDLFLEKIESGLSNDKNN
ncbi:MAG: orotidine-5'-phosphate decarboxylase [Candidatus Humimicrobiaceae bacterium]